MTTDSVLSEQSSTAMPIYRLWDIVRYFLKLGTIGFGGPVALVGYMHRDLVEQRKWISEAEYKEGLTLAQLMPGPLAAQLAIYLGYVHYGRCRRSHRGSLRGAWPTHDLRKCLGTSDPEGHPAGRDDLFVAEVQEASGACHCSLRCDCRTHYLSVRPCIKQES